jgi:CheY-like chemotaxis protein
MDVFTLLEHLKRSPQPPAIIIVSGHADEQEARQLLQRGALDYVTKPVDLNYLQQAVAAAAGSASP